MANPDHVAALNRGVGAWNEWRSQHPDVKPDLSRSEFPGADLRGANLAGASFQGAELAGVRLHGADLSGSNLRLASLGNSHLEKSRLVGASLSGSLMYRANLAYADLTRARLIDTNLSSADLRNATLRFAILERTNLVDANLEDADLSHAEVYGVSAWRVRTNGGTQQRNLRITSVDEPALTVDDLEIAQFVYMLLTRQKIREVIDTLGSKAVLILGRFSNERKLILDALRKRLHQLGFIPLMFDFDRPVTKSLTETIKILAGLSRFVIADITNPRSSPLELQGTVPDFMIPFAPILQEGEPAFAMFVDLQTTYDWVLDVLIYSSLDELLAAFDKAVLEPALKRSQELVLRKAEGIRTRYARDVLRSNP